MANLQVKNVPPELYDELRRRATAQHVTIRDYVLALLRQDQQLLTMDEWLDEVAKLPPVPGVAPGEGARLIREGRRERNRELWGDLGDDDGEV
jgi:hypothetical protein